MIGLSSVVSLNQPISSPKLRSGVSSCLFIIQLNLKQMFVILIPGSHACIKAIIMFFTSNEDNARLISRLPVFKFSLHETFMKNVPMKRHEM